MPAKRPVRPDTRARVLAPVNGSVTPFTQRLIVDASQRSANQLRDRNGVLVDLKVGSNIVNHGLGRKPDGATVTPTVADPSWAWALSSRDERQITIICTGVAQPGAFVEFF